MNEEQRLLVEAVAQANKYIGDKDWYVCAECNKLQLGHAFLIEHPGIDVSTTRTSLACDDCTEYCADCDEVYTKSMRADHEDCGDDD